jgi:hypothetical protein
MTEKKLSEKEKVVILAGIGIAGAVGIYLAYKVSAKPKEDEYQPIECQSGTDYIEIKTRSESICPEGIVYDIQFYDQLREDIATGGWCTIDELIIGAKSWHSQGMLNGTQLNCVLAQAETFR